MPGIGGKHDRAPHGTLAGKHYFQLLLDHRFIIRSPGGYADDDLQLQILAERRPATGSWSHYWAWRGSLWDYGIRWIRGLWGKRLRNGVFIDAASIPGRRVDRVGLPFHRHERRISPGRSDVRAGWVGALRNRGVWRDGKLPRSCV